MQLMSLGIIGLSVKDRKSKALKKVISYGEQFKKVKIIKMTSSEMNIGPEINIPCVKHSTRRFKSKIKDLKDAHQGMEN